MPPVSLQLSSEIEFKEDNMDYAHGDPGRAGHLVDIDRARPKRTDDPLPGSGSVVGRSASSSLPLALSRGGGASTWVSAGG